jgi:hypothetical protein
MHNKIAENAFMNDVTLRAVHPTEAKEIASFSARVLTQMVIAIAGILSFVPFAVYFAQH